MSAALILLVGVIYLGVSVLQFIKGDWPMAIIFFGYAFSNLGFLAAL